MSSLINAQCIKAQKAKDFLQQKSPQMIQSKDSTPITLEDRLIHFSIYPFLRKQILTKFYSIRFLIWTTFTLNLRGDNSLFTLRTAGYRHIVDNACFSGLPLSDPVHAYVIRIVISIISLISVTSVIKINL